MGTTDTKLLLSAFEISGNSFILLGVLIVTTLGVAYGLYTRQGSGINKHPQPDAQDPVIGDPRADSEAPVLDGEDEDEDEHEDERAGIDQSEDSPLDQRGTK